MKKLSLILATILSLTMLAGCGGNSLVGRWEDSSGEYLEIFSDGTYSSSDANYSGSYSVDGDRVKFSGVLMPDETFTYDVSGNTLTLYLDSGEIANEFEKQ